MNIVPHPLINLSLLVAFVGIVNVYLLNKVKFKSICSEISGFFTVILNLFKRPVKAVISHLSYIVYTSRMYCAPEIIRERNLSTLERYYTTLEEQVEQLHRRVGVITDRLRNYDFMLVGSEHGVVGVMQDNVFYFHGEEASSYQNQDDNIQEINLTILQVLNDIQRVKFETIAEFSLFTLSTLGIHYIYLLK